MSTSHLQWWKIKSEVWSWEGRTRRRRELFCLLFLSPLKCQEWPTLTSVYYTFTFWTSHKRSNCHININVVLLEPAQAAKEHSVSVGSILTHHLVNPRAWFQSQSQRLCCAGHCSLADSLQTWPCSSSAPSQSPGWAHIQQLPVTRPSPSASRSAAGQHHGSTTSTSPSLLHDPAASLNWRVVKSQRRQEDFLCSWSEFINHLSAESIPCQANSAWKNKKWIFTLVQKNYPCCYFWIWD